MTYQDSFIQALHNAHHDIRRKLTIQIKVTL